MSIYLRDFKQNSIKIKNKLKISKFIPPGFEELILKNVPSGEYILGVTYRTGDSQIGISGHPKGRETIEDGAARELMEELCLKCKNKILFSQIVYSNYFSFINIRDTEICTNIDKNYLSDSRERAVICVHGPEKDILHYMANVSYNLENEDHIEFIWSTSKENILTYLKNKKTFLTIY